MKAAIFPLSPHLVLLYITTATDTSLERALTYKCADGTAPCHLEGYGADTLLEWLQQSGAGNADAGVAANKLHQLEDPHFRLLVEPVVRVSRWP
jgi:hypothetical protein